MIPCILCGYGASFALECHHTGTNEMMWGSAFCARCAELFCRLLRPLTNPNVGHFIRSRLIDACDPEEVN